MKKAIIIIRTSTDKQEVESQKQEVIELAKYDGYSEEQLIIIGDKGISGIKENDVYNQNIARMKDYITTDSSINSVYVWAIDRLGRREATLMQIKEFLVKNKVNLIVKNPSLRLFNRDGSLNAGMELAFSLFCTLSKQEMEMKLQRFQRAKKRNAAQGKFSGGKISYGYTIREGYVVVNEDEAEVIREIYTLYGSGKYSAYTLTEEINSRGYKRNGKPWTFNYLRKLIAEPRYKGYSQTNKLFKDFPAIIDEELWNKVEQIRKGKSNNPNRTKETRYTHYAIGLLKCSECGHNYIADGERYQCVYGSKKAWRNKCKMGVGINIEVLDKLLEDIIVPLHREEINNLNDEKLQEYKENLLVLNQKLDTQKSRLYTELPIKRKRIQEGYENGIYTEKEYKDKLSKVEVDYYSISAEIKRLGKEIEQTYYLINLEKNPMVDELPDFTDRKKVKSIINRHISLIHISRYQKASVMIEIILHTGQTRYYLYHPYQRGLIEEIEE